MDLILGTAAIGSNYGIANEKLTQSKSSALEILATSMSSNVIRLDTAPQYGRAEEFIGSYHQSNSKFKVYSKIPLGSEVSPKRALESIRTSLQTMRIQKLAGVYFHSTSYLLEMNPKDVLQTIKAIEESQMVDAIGVSVYGLNELERILEDFHAINLIQVPENIMDRRLINSQLILDSKKYGKSYFIRSIFLQGLLLMRQQDISKQEFEVRAGLEKLLQFSRNLGVDPIDICLSYADLISWADSLIVGISRGHQLKRILNYKKVDLSKAQLPTPFTIDVSDPRNWS